MNYIRKYRKAAGLTQHQLATSIHKTVACISQYENDVHVPPIPVAIEIAKTLGCKWTELFEGER